MTYSIIYRIPPNILIKLLQLFTNFSYLINVISLFKIFSLNFILIVPKLIFLFLQFLLSFLPKFFMPIHSIINEIKNVSLILFNKLEHFFLRLKLYIHQYIELNLHVYYSKLTPFHFLFICLLHYPSLKIIISKNLK